MERAEDGRGLTPHPPASLVRPAAVRSPRQRYERLPSRGPRIAQGRVASELCSSRWPDLRVLQVLGRSGALSRAEIAQRVGVSRTTLSELVTTLLNERAIVVTGTDAAARCGRGRGRPAERLGLDPAAGQFLGVDFGNGRVHVVVADASRNIIASGGDSCQPGTEWDRRTALAFELIDQLSAGRSQAAIRRALDQAGVVRRGRGAPSIRVSSPSSRRDRLDNFPGRTRGGWRAALASAVPPRFRGTAGAHPERAGRGTPQPAR